MLNMNDRNFKCCYEICCDGIDVSLRVLIC